MRYLATIFAVLLFASPLQAEQPEPNEAPSLRAAMLYSPSPAATPAPMLQAQDETISAGAVAGFLAFTGGAAVITLAPRTPQFGTIVQNQTLGYTALAAGASMVLRSALQSADIIQ